MSVHGGMFIRRRGSFLVAVVAILSLLAVLTIVYVTVGRTDAQLSAAVQRKRERGQPELIYRDYLAKVIADDVTEAVDPSEVAGNNSPEQPLVREAWDYPSTAWSATFYNPISGEVESRPVTVGGNERDVAYFTPTGEVIIRDGPDEYRVGTGTDPWLSTTEPTWLDYQGDASTTTPEVYPERRVDLGHISNLAPDGAFVNLSNLRFTRAGFNATPWEMRGDFRDGSGLTLYDPNNADPMDRRGVITDFRGGSPIPAKELSSQEETRPFYWSSRQVGAHRPVGDPALGPTDFDYAPYQWADTDGDGAFDARWFELVIDRDPTNNTWNDLFTRQGDLRYFVAATVRDLSALVNVNTATDGTLAASAAEPSGITPSQIDLRRLLTLVDQTRDGQAGNQSPLASYSALSDDTDNYGLYTEAEAFQMGDRAYDAVRLALNESVMPGVLDTGTNINPGYSGLELAAGNAADVDREFVFDTAYYGNNGTGRTDFYNTIASLDPLAGGAWDSSGQYLTAPLFGLDSLEELLTFRRLNDPRRSSRLELAMHGRGDYAPGDDLAGFGPLRSDRAHESASFFNATGPDPAARSSQFLANSLMDIRGRLTTLSGQRPIYGADLPTPSELFALPDDASRSVATQLARVDIREPLDAALLTDTKALFELYADALLPWSDRPGAWTMIEQAPLAYAGNSTQVFGPELALRIAAHMAVNMTDIADNDHEPTRRSLLVDYSHRGDFVNGGNVHEPALPYTLLDLGKDRLATGAAELVDTTGYGRAINVFGIEAQPVITMAGTLAVYSDVPTVFGGNTEKPGPPAGTPPMPTRIPDLDVTFDVGNPDFLFEAIAVELTNPFDEPVDLSGDITQDGGFTYYLQFGDLYFRLADHDDTLPASSPKSVLVLDPGQSRTVYCMSLQPSEVLARLKTASGGGITPTDLSAWITTQFGVDAALMWPMGTAGGAAVTPDLVNGVPLPVSDLGSLTGGMLNILDAGSPTDRDVVRLWRSVRPETISGNPTVNTSVTESATMNDPATDVLVDRLRVPTAETGLLSNVRRTGGLQDIDGATPVEDNMGDNRGLTITQWAMIRRADDPDASSFASGAYHGTLPAWAFEPVDNSTILPRPLGEDGVVDPGVQLKIAQFAAPENHGGDTLTDWYNSTVMAPATNTILPLIVDTPADRATDLVASINTDTRIEHRLTSGAASTISVARLADLLLPMGIGPMQDPGPDLVDPADDRWLTLSEAVAIASVLEDTTSPSTFTDLDTFYEGLGDSVFFFGQLFVDSFVPFYDVNKDGIYDPPATGGDDVAWGLRITPAMRIIQSAMGFTTEQASLIRPAFGTLNINTASLETMRTLPMLSPPVGRDDVLGPTFGSVYNGQNMWWWDDVTNFGQSRSAQQTVDSDIAATLVAYRDRLRLNTRESDRSPLPVLAQTLDFLDPGSTLAGDGPPGYDSTDTGRGAAIGFTGTTELPGIRSIGELLAIRDVNAGIEHSVDRLFDNGRGLTQVGVAGTLYLDAMGNRVDDGILAGGGPAAASDYDEQFAIANSVFNTISIGSDYYAVWFLIHGYSEEDTKADPAQPLVPTVARRFLMVVDRSGVTKRGDAPKIVLFREVPVALP